MSCPLESAISTNSHNLSFQGTFATRNHSTKSSSKQGTSSSYHQQHQYPSTSQQQGTNFTPYNPAKPAKSWDNLTTKAFGGYGFGYGYLDTTSVKAGSAAKGSHHRTHSTKVLWNYIKYYCEVYLLAGK